MNAIGRTPCSTLDRSFHRTELRPFREFLMFARPPRDDASLSGEPWLRENVVFVLTQQVP